MARVLVLGAGFGGIAAATALRANLNPDDDVVLVDRADDFAMGLRKTWAILGISPIAYGTRSLASLSQRGIHIVRGTVESIDAAQRSAVIDGDPYEADALVIALGATQATDAVPGLAEHGHNAWDRHHVEQIHAVVDEFRGGRVAVGIFGVPYPCPPAPYELALLLADRLDARGIESEVTVFGPAPITLPILGAAGCALLDERLEERAIAYLGGRVATAVSAGAVQFADGDRLAFDLLLAVPPYRCPSVLVESGLAPAGGWVQVDRFTLETAHADVYAIGDACCFTAVLRNYDLGGGLVWESRFAIGDITTGNRVAVSGPDIYVVGTEGLNATILDFFVRKYDRTGTALWTHTFGDPSRADWGEGVAATESAVS